jgi:hypothetical protein
MVGSLPVRMTSRPLRPLLTLVTGALATAALAAGCAPSSQSSSNSTSKFQGDARLAAQAVEDLESAAKDDDDEKICTDLLARSLAGRLARSGHTCAATVDEAISDADSLGMTVEQVTVDGDKATARVRLDTGKTDRRTTIQLVRENRRWKIASL